MTITKKAAPQWNKPDFYPPRSSFFSPILHTTVHKDRVNQPLITAKPDSQPSGFHRLLECQKNQSIIEKIVLVKNRRCIEKKQAGKA